MPEANATHTDGAKTDEVLRAIAAAIEAHKDELTELDGPIGDSDHGINMARGFEAVVAELPSDEERLPGEILKQCGSTLVATVGGASGPLYGTAFRKAGVALKGLETVDLSGLSAALDKALDGVTKLGKATVGEKTMVDAMAPTADRLRELAVPDADVTAVLDELAQVASDAAEATIPLRATKGRASYLGERSIGHKDPGATSFAYIMGAIASCYH